MPPPSSHSPSSPSNLPPHSPSDALGSGARSPVAPITVHGFQQLIRERYYATDSARGAAGTFLLFMEEVGELATALHDNRVGKATPPTATQRDNLVEEFADVLAWLATIANIMNVNLDEALKKYTTPGRVEGTKD